VISQVEMKQSILDYYAATIDGDIGRMKTLFTDDVRIWMPPSAAKRGLPRPLVGLDQFMELSRQLQKGGEFWRPTAWTPHAFLFDDDAVAVRVTMNGVMPNGVEYENDYMFVYRFAGNRIAELWEFVDTAWINDFLVSSRQGNS
jgi:ketosteroid isomerase-like protein